MKKTRVLCLLMVICLLVAVLAACGGQSTGGKTSGSASKDESAAKAKPTKIVILDPAGEEPLVKESLEIFKKENPDLVSDYEIIPASAPETTTKIQAEQAAGNLITTYVFTGYDGMCAGMEEDIYEEILPKYKDKLPGLEESFTEAARLQFGMTNGTGIPHACSPGGPMTTYNPDKIANPPKDINELLEFAKANPGKFMYPRPINSGAGYAWLQGLPYLLEEKDPKKPSTWEKVWPFLEEIGKYIDYYPTGSALLYKEFNEGTRWIITTAVGYETNQRVLGAMPPKMTRNFLKNLHWISDANFICIPKGLDEARLNVSLKLTAFLMTPEQQVYTFDDGFMYPGPAIKGVELSMAAKDVQDKLGAVVTPDLTEAINKFPTEAPLGSKELVEAFEMWDELIGSKGTLK